MHGDIKIYFDVVAGAYLVGTAVMVDVRGLASQIALKAIPAMIGAILLAVQAGKIF